MKLTVLTVTKSYSNHYSPMCSLGSLKVRDRSTGAKCGEEGFLVKVNPNPPGSDPIPPAILYGIEMVASSNRELMRVVSFNLNYSTVQISVLGPTTNLSPCLK